MQKLIFFLLAFISLSAHARANWNPYNMTHERFVHLSELDKQAIIISTMELMVELESKYHKEVVNSGFSTERFKKYVQILQKFQNLIFGDAIADDPGVALTSLAGQFSELLTTLKKNGCIYGGYVSMMGNLNGHSYCRHPSTMRKSIPEEAAIIKAYQSSKTCIGSDNITCNPVIFGYTDKTATTPLCVKTSNLKVGEGHNVSYECMKKALAQPGKDDRLSVLATAMSKKENKEAFNKVHSFIFRTCVCKEESSINDKYREYIKPHRTCYGMINTLRALNTEECGQLTKIVPETAFAENWTKYFGSPEVFPKLEPERSATYDTVFGDLMKQKAVQAICDGTPIKEEDPVIVVTPEPDKSKWDCKTTCSMKEPVTPETEKKMYCEVISAGWTRTTEPVFTDAGIKGQKSPIDDIKQPTYKVKVKDPAKPDAELELDCPMTVATEEEAPTSCSIEVAPSKDDATKSTATVTISGKDKEKAVVVWKGGTPTDELPNEITVKQIKGAPQDVSVVFTIKDAPVVEGTCPGVIPPLTETDPTKINYVIDAKAEAALPTTVLVKATITVDGKETPQPENYKISWSRTGSGVEKLAKPIVVKEKETSIVKDTDSESNEVKIDTPVVVVTKGEVATGPSINETRVAEEYSACATLIDDKGVAVTGSSCAPIAALEVEKTKPNQNIPYQQQPQQNQPSFNFQNMNTFTPGF